MTVKRVLLVLTVPLLPIALIAPSAQARAKPVEPPRAPVATGYGGAVSSVDPYATQVGIDVLKGGGNAVDAAVATAAALGVTEPYSAGIGGGGYFVYYDARTKRVLTIDGRETAPLAMGPNAFVENGTPIPFDQAVTSGLSVGVPGTLATWEEALHRWGTLDLRRAVHPAERVRQGGVLGGATVRQQTVDNASRFADFTSTRSLFLPGGQPPAVGSVFVNEDLAETYDRIGRDGIEPFYRGAIAHDLVAAAQQPPVAPGVTRNVRHGLITLDDLRDYDAMVKQPTRTGYRGLDVYSMAPPSSGGSTVGEALNILERFP